MEWVIVDSRVKELANIGLIGPATGNYAAATVILVMKDANGNYTDRHMYGDYEMLNLKTEPDWYSMPIREEISTT